MKKVCVRLVIPLVVLGLLVGCAAKRHAVPKDLVSQVTVEGMPADVRFIGDQGASEVAAARLKQYAEQNQASGLWSKDQHYLAISGGGEDGAFGAGLLCGWTEAGDRPEFNLVTGVSTGALIAPFAFLGPEYDHVIRGVYTTISTKDVMKKRGLLAALAGDAFASNDGLKKLIAEHVDQELVDAIAREHLRGRRLLIGTTNIDMMQPVYWSIGHIATSGRPDALELIRQIMLASTSIPAAFPPQFIEVVGPDGQVYDEMHVDGGVAAQVFSYPLNIDMHKFFEETGMFENQYLYVIRNSKVVADWELVEPKLFALAGRSIGGLILNQGIGDLYQMYLGTLRDKIEFNLAYIPDDFDHVSKSAFDHDYMVALFNRGYEMAKAGYPWQDRPPGYTSDK